MPRTAALERGAKSKAIRELLQQQPTASVPELEAALKQQGVKASTALIAKIKYSGKSRRGRKRRKARGTANGAIGVAQSQKRSSAGASADSINIDHLVAAKKLVEQVGSVEAAQQAVRAFGKLTGG